MITWTRSSVSYFCCFGFLFSMIQLYVPFSKAKRHSRSELVDLLLSMWAKVNRLSFGIICRSFVRFALWNLLVLPTSLRRLIPTMAFRWNTLAQHKRAHTSWACTIQPSGAYPRGSPVIILLTGANSVLHHPVLPPSSPTMIRGSRRQGGPKILNLGIQKL